MRCLKTTATKQIARVAIWPSTKGDSQKAFVSAVRFDRVNWLVDIHVSTTVTAPDVATTVSLLNGDGDCIDERLIEEGFIQKLQVYAGRNGSRRCRCREDWGLGAGLGRSRRIIGAVDGRVAAMAADVIRNEPVDVVVAWIGVEHEAH